STSSRKSFRGSSRGPEAGVRGIPSPFINLDERGRDTPHPSLLPLLPPRKNLFAGLLDGSIAFHQVAIHAAQALRFGSYAAAGSILRIPGVQVDVHPARRLAHEA